MRLTRYSMDTMESGSMGGTYARMMPNEQGDWMKADEVQAVLAECASVIHALQHGFQCSDEQAHTICGHADALLTRLQEIAP